VSFLDLLMGKGSIPPPIPEGAKCRAFAYEDKIIATPVIGIFDGPDPIVLPADVANDKLGQTIFNCTKAYRNNRPDEKLGGSPRKWPSFCASGARTVRQFEQSLWDVFIEARGFSLAINARPYKTLRPHLAMQSVALMKDREHGELGAAFRQALAGAKMLREGGVL